MKFANQKSVAYAEIFVADKAATQSIPTGAGYTKVTLFTDNGQSKRAVADVANNKITLYKAGLYYVFGSFSTTCGTNNVVWRGAAFLDAVEVDHIHWKRKIGTAGDAGNAGFTGFLTVSTVPVDLDFRVRHDNGGSVDLTLEYANLNAFLID